MEPNKERSIVLQPSHELTVLPVTLNRILGEMVEASLALARQTPLFKIGDYEWCDPDYRQILLWAEALKMEPVTVIGKLVAGENSQDVTTRFQNGRILSLCWNLAELPLTDFKCVEGLIVERLRLYEPDLVERNGGEVREVSLCLRSLRLLECWCNCKIGALTLSNAPNLTELYCDGNQITELDLSHAPNLTKVECNRNQITELNLSQVPNLVELLCAENQISELDLSHVPKLTRLWCSGNQLTELDLTHIPNLTALYCDRNRLTRLDLSHVPNLPMLWCDGNQIAKLDLSQIPNLTDLCCTNNRLTELDIRPLLSLETVIFDDRSTRLIQRPDQHFEQ